MQRATLGHIIIEKKNYRKRQKIRQSLCESYDRGEKSIEIFLSAIIMFDISQSFKNNFYLCAYICIDNFATNTTH